MAELRSGSARIGVLCEWCANRAGFLPLFHDLDQMAGVRRQVRIRRGDVGVAQVVAHLVQNRAGFEQPDSQTPAADRESASL